ncbi:MULTISPECIES: hypothetical protein [Actinomadura]|uniref:Uncharacterized protein n=1 Tax=Actinomadura miaoliensis TaxID=430685 RepID=A0ABP7WX73_9ACTN
MSRLPNRPAALQAYKELAAKFPPGATVGHRAHPSWRGTVSAEGRRSIRLDRAPSGGYQLWVFVAWDHMEAMWVYAADLTAVAQPADDADGRE